MRDDWHLNKMSLTFWKGLLNYTITPNWHSLTVGYDDDILVWSDTSFVSHQFGLTAEDRYRALIAKFKGGIDSGEQETISDLENQIAAVKGWVKEAKEFLSPDWA